MDLIERDEPYEWTDEDIIKAIDETGSMSSMVLRRRLNSTKDGLAGQPSVPLAPSALPAHRQQLVWLRRLGLHALTYHASISPLVTHPLH